MEKSKTKTRTKEVTFRKLNSFLLDLQINFMTLSLEEQNKGKKITASMQQSEEGFVTKFENNDFELYIAMKEKGVCHG